jgi:hypothetical protein
MPRGGNRKGRRDESLDRDYPAADTRRMTDEASRDLYGDTLVALYGLERALNVRPFLGIWWRIFDAVNPPELIQTDAPPETVLLAILQNLEPHAPSVPPDPLQRAFLAASRLKKSEIHRIAHPAVKSGWLTWDLKPQIPSPWAWDLYPCACIVADDGHLVAVSRCEGPHEKFCDFHLVRELLLSFGNPSFGEPSGAPTATSRECPDCDLPSDQPWPDPVCMGCPVDSSGEAACGMRCRQMGYKRAGERVYPG